MAIDVCQSTEFLAQRDRRHSWREQRSGSQLRSANLKKGYGGQDSRNSQTSGSFSGVPGIWWTVASRSDRRRRWSVGKPAVLIRNGSQGMKTDGGADRRAQGRFPHTAANHGQRDDGRTRMIQRRRPSSPYTPPDLTMSGITTNSCGGGSVRVMFVSR